MYTKLICVLHITSETNENGVINKHKQKYYNRASNTQNSQLESSNTSVQHLKWSDWSPWTSCSRSCGGGIKMRMRNCVSTQVTVKIRNSSRQHWINNYKFRNKCIGDDKLFRICNDQECSNSKSDFRTVQCQNFNQKAFTDIYYSWEPYNHGNTQCALNCKPVGFRFYATLNSTVIDGTPCNIEGSARSVCVQGDCKVVGCDNVINGQKYDMCGICGGDNSTCRIISGLYTKPHLPPGYNFITEIPYMATNLSIVEMKHTNNLIALRYKNGTYIINGNYTSHQGGALEAAGSTFTYTKGDDKSRDTITAMGPLQHPIDLLLLYRQMNLGIKYEYRIAVPISRKDSVLISETVTSEEDSISNYDQMSEGRKYDAELERERKLLNLGDNNNPALVDTDVQGFIRDEESKPRNKIRKKKFMWKIVSYTPCTKTCGGGTQTPVFSCVRENNPVQTVPEKRCVGVEKPSFQTIRCNSDPCEAQWVIGEWSECSVTCGEGVETRDLSCKQEISPKLTVTVNQKACLSSTPNLLRTRPCFKLACNNSIIAMEATIKPYWQVGPWSMCSVKCGIGKMSRKIQCISKQNKSCPMDEHPAEYMSCNMGPCESHQPYVWFTTEWTKECSEGCGTGIQTRKVFCSAGPEFESLCDQNSKPDLSRICSSDKQCSGQWFSGPWSQCSEICGWGKQRRTVICVASLAQNSLHQAVSNTNCTEKERPSLEQACFEKPCNSLWYAATWSVCSRSCNSGVQRREVRCLNEDMQPTEDCTEEEKPATRRSCNVHRCSLYNSSVTMFDDVTVSEGHTESVPTPTPISNKLEGEQKECTDKLSKCNLVIQARLCIYKYYQNFCCVSCHSSINSHSTANKI